MCDGLIVAFVDPQIATRALVVTLVVMMAKAFGLFLKQHPVEEITSETEIIRKAAEGAGKSNAGGSSNGIVTALGITFLLFMGLMLSGCARLQPGADPLVVRVEQAETGAVSTFDLVLRMDDTDREFWKQKAPGFHSFAEFLREPLAAEGTNTEARALSLVRSLDVIKKDYQAGRASSNAVTAALATLRGLLAESAKQLSAVTNTAARKGN